MRSLPLLGILLLTSFATGQKVKTVLNNGPVGNRYDIVILGDGYQASEEAKFDQDVQKAINKLFSKSSYKAYKNFFNAHSVFRASNESGADHPDRSPPIVKDTAYDASYNTGGTPRCLYIKNTSRAQADSRLAPDVEGRVIVLVNDTRYGGCAGTFSVSYTGSSGAEVQAHEFGHSFGRLADEYDYGRTGSYTGPEPSQANITKDSTGKAKWPLWLGYNGISAFQGAGYYKTGLWRPKIDCLMRTLNVPLCEICNEQIVKQAYVTVNPIENRVPKASKIGVKRGASPTFSISSLIPGKRSIIWSVNSKQVATDATKFTWNTSTYAAGSYTVEVTIKDLTSFVRKDATNLLTSSERWAVDLTSGWPGSFTTLGAGCQGSAGEPQLRAFGGSLPKLNTQFTVVLSSLPTRQKPFMLVGASNTQWNSLSLPLDLRVLGAPTCMLRVGIDVTVPLSNLGGAALFTLLIPGHPKLAGRSFYLQGIVMDPAANSLGIALSTAGKATIGN